MYSTNTLLFGLLILLVTVISVQSIKCYECTGCNDPFNDNIGSTSECLGSCIKAKAYGIMVRSCSDDNQGDKCTENGDTFLCSCTSDLCNSASGFKVSFPVFCISALILFLGLF